MRQPLVDDVVRLIEDVPELELSRGETGVVRSTWFAPMLAYEVEFESGIDHGCTRTLLRAEQLIVERSLGLAESTTH